MPKLKSTEEFVIDAKDKHGDLYDYSRVQYKGKDVKVDIICKFHGIFSKSPHNHIKGQGCPTCNGQHPKDSETFILSATEVHGTTYDYSLVKYSGSKNKVEIICPIHGAFWQTASNHLSGARCGKCHGNYNTTTESFIEDASKVHKGRYSYKRLDYKTSQVKVIITCPMHGDFLQTPTSHISGRGCPQCMTSGYRATLPGTIYILSDDTYVKVGITNRSAKLRSSEVSRSSGKDMLVSYFITFSDGSIAKAVENEMLKYLKRNFSCADSVFDGSTETFMCSEVIHIKSALLKEVSTYFATS